MKKQFLSFFFLSLAFVSYGQSNKITLTGSIEIYSGEVFPYKVVFTETGGIIRGYSLTYKEPDETRAKITGTFDRRNRTISFKETEIVYSHGFHTKAFMCLIDAHVEYLSAAGGKMLKGPITSTDVDKTACTAGVLTFNDQDEMKNLFDIHEKFDTVITMKKKVYAAPDNTIKPPATVIEKPLVTDKITKGIEKTYEWHSDTAIIDIWDGGTVDGDQVTLAYNGKPLLTKYSLVKQKKQLRVPVSKQGVDIITILADNEGSDPPNTADLMLTDGKTQYSILSYNNKGQVSVIKIKKAP